MIVRDSRPRERNWGEATDASKARVARLEQMLRQGPRDPTTFEDLRAELNEPAATDGEIYQAAVDAGLIVEDS